MIEIIQIHRYINLIIELLIVIESLSLMLHFFNDLEIVLYVTYVANFKQMCFALTFVLIAKPLTIN
jgi:hypothetical protein